MTKQVGQTLDCSRSSVRVCVSAYFCFGHNFTTVAWIFMRFFALGAEKKCLKELFFVCQFLAQLANPGLS